MTGNPDGRHNLGDKMFETTEQVDWQFVRTWRNLELKNTDWWAVKDLTMSQAKKDYRIFLRDLPQNYLDPVEAWDAWVAYKTPE